MSLTRRQQDILDLLRERAEREQHPPTLDELCALLGLRSRGSLHKQIRALVEAGLVEPMRGRHRGVRLLPQPAAANCLPLLGKIAAGRPIEAIEQPEQIEVPSQLRTSRPCYVLRVEGESMREAGILDGDYVVIEQCDSAADGDIVVALIGGEEATLKRILQRPGRVILYPENSAMQAMEYDPDEVQIQGVLVGQMRAYR
jgi:repressor LexA